MVSNNFKCNHPMPRHFRGLIVNICVLSLLVQMYLASPHLMNK